MDTNVITSAIDAACNAVKSVFDWLTKGTLDKTEVEKAKIDLQKTLAGLEFSKQQLSIWVQQALIDLEKVTAAHWRTPLILVSGSAIVLVSVNNILAYTYLPAARLISLASPEMGVLVGLFILLVAGDPTMLLSLFKRSDKQNKEGG